MNKYCRYFICDFETTVEKDTSKQTSTEVWAAACVEMNTQDVVILGSIDAWFEYFISMKTTVQIYFHNLKFDGSFVLSYLLKRRDYTQKFIAYDPEEYNGQQLYDIPQKKELENGTFTYLISDGGIWYSIVIKTRQGKYITIYDSMKLLPFSVKAIGEGFKTEHRKLEMDYKAEHYANCVIPEDEKHYIENDVFVVKEAMEYMFSEGHTKLTIGSCCLSEWKSLTGKDKWSELFPRLDDISIDPVLYGQDNVDSYIRRAYKGGYCIVKPGCEGIVWTEGGQVYDVNSLYPSEMHSVSGNEYPYGIPIFWKGEIPEEALAPHHYYYVRLQVRFRLKEGYLPTIQIKNSFSYSGTEYLKTNVYKDCFGNPVDKCVELTMAMTDFWLLKEHYDLLELHILDGCYFDAQAGMFDEYIDKYQKIKATSKGAPRTTAKLFNNNLYGKLATSPNNAFKIASLFNGILTFKTVKGLDKAAVYIAAGAAVTAYARYFTITHAQKNYDRFIYADTDSLHLAGTEQPDNLDVHPTALRCWKNETTWDVAIFARQKTYIEHVIIEDGEEVDPYFNVRCAGMNEECKRLLRAGLNHLSPDEFIHQYNLDAPTPMQKAFLETGMELRDFKPGLQLPGKLRPKQVIGGTLLTDTVFTMR